MVGMITWWTSISFWPEMFKASKESRVTFPHSSTVFVQLFHFQMGNMMKHLAFTPKLLTWILKCLHIMGTEASAILRLNTMGLLWKMLIKQLTWIRNILRYEMLKKKDDSQLAFYLVILFLFLSLLFCFNIVFNNYTGILQESISLHGSWKI